jgi:hypothetical protein
MILADFDYCMREFLQKLPKVLGTAPNRLEEQVLCAGNLQRPDDQFFTMLAEVYNDPNFEVSLQWSDVYLSTESLFRLDGRREPSYLRTQWAKLLTKYETACNRYTVIAVVSTGSVFVYVGQKGLQLLWVDPEEREPVPGNKAWHPPADKSVYLCHVDCENCDVFETKSMKVLPENPAWNEREVGPKKPEL